MAVAVAAAREETQAVAMATVAAKEAAISRGPEEATATLEQPATLRSDRATGRESVASPTVSQRARALSPYELKAMKVSELRQLLKALGQPIGGKKDKLVERLMAATAHGML